MLERYQMRVQRKGGVAVTAGAGEGLEGDGGGGGGRVRFGAMMAMDTVSSFATPAPWQQYTHKFKRSLVQV